MATSTTDEHLESDDDSSSKRHSTPLSNADLTVLVCFFASGFLALTYEVCWIRKSTHVFGAASLAVSTVLGVFFGGLALGSYLFGRRAPQVKMPMMWYAALEVGVGVLAMLSPYAFRLADQAYTHFYPQVQDSFALLSCTRLLLVTIVVLPPTILMGAHSLFSVDNTSDIAGLFPNRSAGFTESTHSGLPPVPQRVDSTSFQKSEFSPRFLFPVLPISSLLPSSGLLPSQPAPKPTTKPAQTPPRMRLLRKTRHPQRLQLRRKAPFGGLSMRSFSLPALSHWETKFSGRVIYP